MTKEDDLVRIRINGDPQYVDIKELRNGMQLAEGFVSRVLEDPKDPDYVIISRVDTKTHHVEPILRHCIKPSKSPQGQKPGAGVSAFGSYAIIDQLSESFGRAQIAGDLRKPSDVEQVWPLFETVKQIFNTIQSDKMMDLDANEVPDYEKDKPLQVLQRDLGKLEDKIEILEMELKESLLKGPGRTFFYGFPGRGKTTLINNLIKHKMPSEEEFKDMNADAIKSGGAFVEKRILPGPKQEEGEAGEGLFVVSNGVERSEMCGAILDTDEQVLQQIPMMDFTEDGIFPTSRILSTTTCCPMVVKFGDCFMLYLHYKSLKRVQDAISEAKKLSSEISVFLQQERQESDFDLNEDEDEHEDQDGQRQCPSVTYSAFEAMAMIGAPKKMDDVTEEHFRKLTEKDFVIPERFKPRLGNCLRIIIRGPTRAEAQDTFCRLLIAHTVGCWSHFGLLESVTAYVPSVGDDEQWRSMEFFDAAGFIKSDPYRKVLTQHALEKDFHILVHVMDKAKFTSDESTGLEDSRALLRIAADPKSYVVVPFLPWDKESGRPTLKGSILNEQKALLENLKKHWVHELKGATSKLSSNPAIKKRRREELNNDAPVYPFVLSVVKDTEFEELKLERLVEKLEEEQRKKLERDLKPKVNLLYRRLHQAMRFLMEICELDDIPNEESRSLFIKVRTVGPLLTSTVISVHSALQEGSKKTVGKLIDAVCEKCSEERFLIQQKDKRYEELISPNNKLALGRELRHGAEKDPLDTPLADFMLAPLRKEVPIIVRDQWEPLFHEKVTDLVKHMKAPIEDALETITSSMTDASQVVLNIVKRKLRRTCNEAVEVHEKEFKDQVAQFSTTVDNLISDCLPKYLKTAYFKRSNRTTRLQYLGRHCNEAAVEIGEEIKTQAWKLLRSALQEFSNKIYTISQETIRFVKGFNSENMEELKKYRLAPYCLVYARLFAESAKMLKDAFTWVTAADIEDERRLDSILAEPNPWSKLPPPDAQKPEAGPSSSNAPANPVVGKKRLSPSSSSTPKPESPKKKPKTGEWPCDNPDCPRREQDLKKKLGSPGGPALCKLCDRYFKRTQKYRPNMPVRTYNRG